jgi:hypothetical protein
MATVREAIVFWLNGIASLTSIIGSRIYWERPSQLSFYPCLMIESSGRTYGHNLSGADGVGAMTFKFTGLAITEAVAVSIIEALRNNMDGFRGMQNGVAVLVAFLDEENDDTSQPIDGSDRWIYEVSAEYSVRHRVPLPTNVTQTNV